VTDAGGGPRRLVEQVAGVRVGRERLALLDADRRQHAAHLGERLKPGELGSLLALLNFPIQTWIPTSECALSFVIQLTRPDLQ